MTWCVLRNLKTYALYVLFHCSHPAVHCSLWARHYMIFWNTSCGKKVLQQNDHYSFSWTSSIWQWNWWLSKMIVPQFHRAADRIPLRVFSPDGCLQSEMAVPFMWARLKFLSWHRICFEKGTEVITWKEPKLLCKVFTPSWFKLKRTVDLRSYFYIPFYADKDPFQEHPPAFGESSLTPGTLILRPPDLQRDSYVASILESTSGSPRMVKIHSQTSRFGGWEHYWPIRCVTCFLFNKMMLFIANQI